MFLQFSYLQNILIWISFNFLSLGGPTNQKVLTCLSLRMRERVYKTLCGRMIYYPMTPPSHLNQPSLYLVLNQIANLNMIKGLNLILFVNSKNGC